jgi:hypothetical protein
LFSCRVQLGVISHSGDEWFLHSEAASGKPKTVWSPLHIFAPASARLQEDGKGNEGAKGEGRY